MSKGHGCEVFLICVILWFVLIVSGGTNNCWGVNWMGFTEVCIQCSWSIKLADGRSFIIVLAFCRLLNFARNADLMIHWIGGWWSWAGVANEGSTTLQHQIQNSVKFLECGRCSKSHNLIRRDWTKQKLSESVNLGRCV